MPWNGVPTIYKNVAILGATTGEIRSPTRRHARVRRAHRQAAVGLPHRAAPGELGHDTWLDNGWRNRSGINVWAWSMTLDAARGMLYMPVAGPAANYWGGDRPGNNLFGNSIVAVDARDRQIPLALPDRAPRSVGLGHAESAGARGHQAERPARARARLGRQDGLMFILNRETGKPVLAWKSARCRRATCRANGMPDAAVPGEAARRSRA